MARVHRFSASFPRVSSAAAIVVVCAGGAFAALAAAPQEQSPGTQPNAAQLIREVVNRELDDARNDHSMWCHTQILKEDGTTKELALTDTPKGGLHRLLAVNGEPLTAQESRIEDDRIARVIRNPGELAAEARKGDEDVEKEERLIEMLPVAFDYKFESRDGGVAKFDFTPDPSFRSMHGEAIVFHHMEGSIWIDVPSKHIVRFDGRLTHEVRFAGGILGHLDAGGVFTVERMDVGAGHWETTLLNVHMHGKELFLRTISVDQDEKDFDYAPVPQGVTLQQAAALLKQRAGLVASAQANGIR
jgi:hypothetical protein